MEKPKVLVKYAKIYGFINTNKNSVVFRIYKNTRNLIQKQLNVLLDRFLFAYLKGGW